MAIGRGARDVAPVAPPAGRARSARSPPEAAGGTGRGVASSSMEEFLRPSELLIILVLVLVLFGGAKLPELARNLGRAQHELRRGLREGAEPDPLADTERETGHEAEHRA